MEEKDKQIAALAALITKAEKLHGKAMDETLDEDVTDQFYARYWQACSEIAISLQNLLKINRAVATKMAHHKRGEMMELVRRWRPLTL